MRKFRRIIILWSAVIIIPIITPFHVLGFIFGIISSSFFSGIKSFGKFRDELKRL